MNTGGVWNAADYWSQSDAVLRAVALVLLLMSVTSWVVMLYKATVLTRCSGNMRRAVAAFWQAPDLAQGRERLLALERERFALSLLDACMVLVPDPSPNPLPGALPGPVVDTLAGAGPRDVQLTRLLRDALHLAQGRLHSGQVLLASVGATAPFVGLLGTVWGIYLALISMADAAQITLAQLSAPVGEALVMTAAGLAVAIPAVLGYNLLGRQIARIEAQLQGWARDLLGLLAPTPQSAPQAAQPVAP